LITLAVAPLVLAHFLQRHAEHLGRGGLVHVVAVLEGVAQALVARQVRHDAQLDLRVVGGDDLAAGGAMKASRMRRPCGVRIGMFCRFGIVGGEAAGDRAACE
jgi:alkyl hydroperoxide reductase subunit AhpF